MKYSSKMSLSFKDGNVPKGILIHGDSLFHKQLKAKLIVKKNGSFQTASLKKMDESSLLSSPLSLETHMQSHDMFSGPEIIMVTEATDKMMKDFSKPTGDLPLFVIAKGYLKPSSKLRQYFESEPDLLCIPCYDLTPEDLKPYIVQFFKDHEKQIDSTLAHRLAVTFQDAPDTLDTELQKIHLYVGDAPEVSADAVRNIISTSYTPETRDFVDALLNKDKSQFFLCLQHLETETLIPTLRTLYGSLLRLHNVHCLMEEGLAFEQAIMKLSPPPFFKEKGVLKKQTSQWPKHHIEALLASITAFEVDIKKGTVGVKYLLSTHLNQALIQ